MLRVVHLHLALLPLNRCVGDGLWGNQLTVKCLQLERECTTSPLKLMMMIVIMVVTVVMMMMILMIIVMMMMVMMIMILTTTMIYCGSLTVAVLHTASMEIEAADQTCNVSQSQYSDIRPTSCNNDLIIQEVWQGSH